MLLNIKSYKNKKYVLCKVCNYFASCECVDNAKYQKGRFEPNFSGEVEKSVKEARKMPCHVIKKCL